MKKPSRLSASISVPDEISLAKAASSIDDAQLLCFLADLKASPESQQMMQLVDYFRKPFANVSATQFPWPKMFEESDVDIMLDIPLCYISESVYNASFSWISKYAPKDLSDFILWCLEEILVNLASEKSSQHSPSKAQVEIFVVLAWTVRARGCALFPLRSTLRDNPKYQGQDKFPLIVWLIGQASVENSIIGLHFCVRYFFPLILENSSLDRHSRDLSLQLIERILLKCIDSPSLYCMDFHMRERMVPASSLDLLMRAAFPAPSSSTMESVMFVRIYRCLKQVALATQDWVNTQRKQQKLLSEQFLPYAVRAMQERDNPKLTQEGTDLFIWCIAHSDEGYEHWEKLVNADVWKSVLKRIPVLLNESLLELVHLKISRDTFQTLNRRCRFSWMKTMVLLSGCLIFHLLRSYYLT